MDSNDTEEFRLGDADTEDFRLPSHYYVIAKRVSVDDRGQAHLGHGEKYVGAVVRSKRCMCVFTSEHAAKTFIGRHDTGGNIIHLGSPSMLGNLVKYMKLKQTFRYVVVDPTKESQPVDADVFRNAISESK